MRYTFAISDLRWISDLIKIINTTNVLALMAAKRLSLRKKP